MIAVRLQSSRNKKVRFGRYLLITFAILMIDGGVSGRPYLDIERGLDWVGLVWDGEVRLNLYLF